MKQIICLILTVFILGCAKKQPAFNDYPITSVSIKDVELTDNFWLPKITLIQDTTIKYAFDKCDKEGRMENFLIAGGKKKGKVRGLRAFDDTDLYKIIEGASYSLISKPNPGLDAYLDSIINLIRIGQEPDGYLTTWFTIDPLNCPGGGAPSKHRWEHEEGNHELYNSGHLMEAATAHYFATGKRNFLDIAIKNADLLVESFGPGKLTIPPGHQIIETGLVKLYRITHNEKYLRLAKYFLDWRGDSTTHKLYGKNVQDHIPVTRQDEAVGHAVRAVYMYAGMTDIAALNGDKSYLEAVNKIWDNMVTRKMHLTGGIGSNADGEAFGNNYELPNRTCYNETCAAIGSVMWNQRMFLLTGDSKYYDVLERTLYNGLISGLSLDGKCFFYPNPLESNGIAVSNNGYGAVTRQSWFDCSCCPTNLIRFIPSVPGLIYANAGDNLYVNLYVSSRAQVAIENKTVEISQCTDYPWNGKVEITVKPEKKTKFTLKLRVPGWAQNNPVPGNLYAYIDKNQEKITLRINGRKEQQIISNGYFEIAREWNKTDKIELTLPMPVRQVIANPKVAEDRDKVAFERGPIVYCFEGVDNNDNATGIVTYDISHVNYTYNPTLLNGVETLQLEGRQVSKHANTNAETIKDVSLKAVPYYAWANRGNNTMSVWVPREKIKYPFINQQTIGLDDWKFSSGDNPKWSQPGFDDTAWKKLKTGSAWEAQGFPGYKGYAWYRIRFNLPSGLKSKTLSDSLCIWLGKIFDGDQTFLNGHLIGQNGLLVPANATTMPDLDKEASSWSIDRNYILPANAHCLLWDRENVLAVRVRGASWGWSGLVTAPLNIKMKDLMDYLSFDFGSKAPETKPDGTMVRTLIIKNLSPLPEIKGTLITETFAKGGRKTNTQTSQVSLKKDETPVPFTINLDTKPEKIVYTFTEQITGRKKVYVLEM